MIPLYMVRGGLIGFLHLSVGRKLLQFLEQDLDPLQTKKDNVDLRTKEFIHLIPFDEENLDRGNFLIHKL